MKTAKPLLIAFSAALLVASFPARADQTLALAANEDANAPTTPVVATPVPSTAPVAAAEAAPPATTPESAGDAADKALTEQRKADIASKVRNPTLRSHLMENIDVFGKNDLPAIYILGPGIEDFEGQLLTRDFVRDPFFMQNIDREEFEMKLWLRGDLDEEKKKDEAKN